MSLGVFLFELNQIFSRYHNKADLHHRILFNGLFYPRIQRFRPYFLLASTTTWTGVCTSRLSISQHRIIKTPALRKLWANSLHSPFSGSPKILRLDKYRVLKRALTDHLGTDAMRFIAAKTSVPAAQVYNASFGDDEEE